MSQHNNPIDETKAVRRRGRTWLGLRENADRVAPKCRPRSLVGTPDRHYVRMTGEHLPMSFEIETARLSLRLMAPVDGTLLLELEGEHEGGTNATLAETQALIADQNLKSRASGIGFLTAERRIERDAIGYCGLFVGRASFDEPEIAYELLRRVHGHGYATEAARAVLDAAWATGRTRVWSTVGAWNAPSLRVLEKLGFHRDHSVTDERGETVYMVRDA